MTKGNTTSHTNRRHSDARATDHVFEAKLHRPPTRASWVRRQRLLEALDRATSLPVTLVAAPAGYGKTTLLAHWLALGRAPATAWLSLDEGDNDPDRLWAHVAVALERAGCVLPTGESGGESGESTGPAFGRTLLPAMTNALAAHPDEVVLVLDDFHCVREQECHDQVQHLIATLPPQAHLVLVTRSDPALRLGRLRASGDLAELRADDLGFTVAETTELLAAADVHLTDASLATLMERTEGWPAGLYLATLSLTGLQDPDEFVERFGGGNRFIGDYLIEEVLTRQEDRVREFITTASFLDRFCASLCDHVAGTDDAATILHDLERSNLFVVPLDEDHEWFRFHHLFAAVARSEQELKDPRAVRHLHSAAADWFVRHGQVDQAVEHLLAAARTDDAAELVQAHWLPFVDAGRSATVDAWLHEIGTETVERNPHARVTAAWMSALGGHLSVLHRHLDALRELDDDGPLPDGSRSIESAVLQVEATFAYDGPLAAQDAARRLLEVETDESSPQHAIAQLALGHAAYVLGDLGSAAGALRAAASAPAPVIVQVQSLSLQSLVEAEQGDLLGARQLAERAVGLAEAQGLRATPQASLAMTAFGLAQAAAGKLDDALATLDDGVDPHRLPWAATSWATTHHLLATARVTASAGRLTTARRLVDEVLGRLARFPSGTEAMRLRVADVALLLREDETDDVAEEPLTKRELEVLRLLQSDLTPQEIADELYLTFNTVKTHAGSIYRKLRAHSRSEAVVAARRRSLI